MPVCLAIYLSMLHRKISYYQGNRWRGGRQRGRSRECPGAPPRVSRAVRIF